MLTYELVKMVFSMRTFFKPSGSTDQKIFFVVFVFLFLPLSSSIGAAPTWVERVMRWTINGQFEQAEHFLQQKIEQSDSALLPCFYLASVLNSKMNYYENQQEAVSFGNLLRSVINRSNHKLNSLFGNDSLMARLYFYRGSAYGYLAYFQGQNGHWFNALKNGLKAVNDLKTAVRLDSTLYEAYLGLGTYKYWRSTKLKFALWLPFVPDQRQEGIRDIKHALKSSSNSRYMALHQLIYILTDYGHYDEALHYAQEGISAFPKSPFMWWAYAHTYFKAHQYAQAAKAYAHLLHLIEKKQQRNLSQWLACSVRLAEIYRRMGNRTQARTLAVEILHRENTFPPTELNKKRLKKVRLILEETH